MGYRSPRHDEARARGASSVPSRGRAAWAWCDRGDLVRTRRAPRRGIERIWPRAVRRRRARPRSDRVLEALRAARAEPPEGVAAARPELLRARRSPERDQGVDARREARAAPRG